MSRGQKILSYAVGFVLGCLILVMIPREKAQPKEHPWHAQTAIDGTYPMTLVDDIGHTVRLEEQPRHFISLAPSITEILFAMDMGDHLMAVTQWCSYPGEAKALRDAGAHVGSMDQPNRETIAAYAPDLILGTDHTPPDVYNAIANPPDTVVAVVDHDGMDDLIEDIKLIGRMTGVPSKTLRLVNELQAQRTAVERRVATVAGLPRRNVLYLLSIEEDLQAGWAPGKDAWVSELIEASNAESATAKIGPSWGEVSFETLISLDPEVILVREAETPAQQALLENRIRELAMHPVWSKVKVVQNNRIHYLPYGPLTIPGPRMMQAYSAIADAIWSDQPSAQSGQ